jgi:hypothetical protein
MNGMRFFLESTNLPVRPFASEKPLPPVATIAGMRIHMACRMMPLTVTIASFDINSSVTSVDVQKQKMQSMAILPKIAWARDFIS